MAYQGVRMGSVQTTYGDQPVSGMPGQQASINDLSLIDGYPVEETNGVGVGVGVVQGTAITAPNNTYYNVAAPFGVSAVTSSTVAANLVGVTIRDSGMSNDASGNPLWENQRMVPVMRKGRVYVAANVATTAGAAVFMIIDNSNGNSGNIPNGSFVTTALGGDAIAITNARWWKAAEADTIGVIEFNLDRQGVA